MTSQSRRGRPPRTTPDTRTTSEKLAVRLAKRRAKALQEAAVFDSLPDFARIKQPVVEALFSKSHATIWRNVKDATIPAPHKDGGTVYWLAGDLRKCLRGQS